MVGRKCHVIAAVDLVLQLEAIRTKAADGRSVLQCRGQAFRVRLNRARLLTSNLPFTLCADFRQAAMAATLRRLLHRSSAKGIG